MLVPPEPILNGTQRYLNEAEWLLPRVNIILSGLQIRVKGNDYNFNYAWSPASGCPRMVDWINIRNVESTSPHIRCYWLNDEKEGELSTLMASGIDCETTVVLILVNTKDDFEVDTKFLHPNEKYGFPVAVITHSVGQNLKEIFERYDRDVEARMEITSVTTSTNIQANERPKEGEYPQNPKLCCQ